MPPASIDPITLAVIANRFDAIVREMVHVVVRSARSVIINTARDLSCSIITADGQLLTIGDAIPMQVMGGQFQARALRQFQPDIKEGDAFLHNDPYNGGTHAADHTILVPVFHEGEHLFTVACVAHEGDCGNSVPTTYMWTARDVYHEGALIFPCVRVQQGYESIDDIVRMCRARIRLPDQWYGDFLAQIGAARVGEQRIKELLGKYPVETVKAFVREWLDYSERRMTAAIRRMPAGTHASESRFGPVHGVDDDLRLRFKVTVHPEDAMIDVDLRDNPDCVPAGVNMTEATSYGAAMIGVLNSIPEVVPANEGTFRRVRVHLRENCVAGIPRHPVSCSAATTEVPQKVINAVQVAFAQFGDGYGLAEGGSGHPAAAAVISGTDPRYDGRQFLNEVYISSCGGGPGSPSQDGWVTYSTPSTAGVMHPSGVELTELRTPIIVEELRILTDSGGPGRRRGAPGSRVAYHAAGTELRAMFNLENPRRPPVGVLGGLPGSPMRAFVRRVEGSVEELPAGPHDIQLQPGEAIISQTCGGGGYGPPELRERVWVDADLEEGWVSPESAEDPRHSASVRETSDAEAATAVSIAAGSRA